MKNIDEIRRQHEEVKRQENLSQTDYNAFINGVGRGYIQLLASIIDEAVIRNEDTIRLVDNSKSSFYKGGGGTCDTRVFSQLSNQQKLFLYKYLQGKGYYVSKRTVRTYSGGINSIDYVANEIIISWGNTKKNSKVIRNSQAFREPFRIGLFGWIFILAIAWLIFVQVLAKIVS